MDVEPIEYWSATDQVIELARKVILGTESNLAQEVDLFLDYRPGFLMRVVDNLATAAYLQIAEQLGFNLNDQRIVSALLHPLDVFSVVPVATPITEDIEKGIYWGVQAVLKGDRPLADGVIPLYIEQNVSPAGYVLNGAMPVIVSLISKNVPLVAEPAMPFSAAEREAKLDSAIGFIRARLRSWLQI